MTREVREVAVLRALGLGDLLTAVPTLRGLRKAFPTHRIKLLAPAWLSPLAVLTGAVDEVLPTSGLPNAAPNARAARVRASHARAPHAGAPHAGAPHARARAPHVAVNLHGRGPQSHFALRRLSPSRLLAFAHPAVPEVEGPTWRAGEHEVIRWCRLLEFYGLDCDPKDLEIAVPPGDAEPESVIIHPGAGSPARRWPADRFAEVARTLEREGHRVVVTGSTVEYELCRNVTDAAGLDPSSNLAGTLSVLRLAALVARARLIVCGDTGIGHLATAYRTPSVLLFGPMTPALWGPPPERAGHVALWTGRSGDPHGRRVHPGLVEIPAGQVIEAARELLATAVAGEGK
jgi:ADP-heptose:LPS heptosyltransferase